MITPDQIREARRLLGWNADWLAKKANCSIRTVHSVEAGVSQSNKIMAANRLLQTILEAAGVEFVDGAQPGARLRARP